MPVEFAKNVQLAINLDTAKEIGMSESLLLSAIGRFWGKLAKEGNVDLMLIGG